MTLRGDRAVIIQIDEATLIEDVVIEGLMQKIRITHKVTITDSVILTDDSPTDDTDG